MLKSILLLVLGASLGVSSFAFRQDAMAVLKVADPTSEGTSMRACDGGREAVIIPIFLFQRCFGAILLR